jgi:hypothetical protein
MTVRLRSIPWHQSVIDWFVSGAHLKSSGPANSFDMNGIKREINDDQH